MAAMFTVLLILLRVLVPQGPAATNASAWATRYPLLPYQPWALSNLLPEIDQLKLGTYVVAFVDPIINQESAGRLRKSLLAVYRPMEQDPAFRELGSAMSYAYADEDSGHLYTYIPRSAPRIRPPAVVFLHGSAGNFKGYLQVWKPIADSAGFVLVAPSFGFGNWHMPGGMEAIERARKHALDQLGADPKRVYLAGLSNGGRGVTRAIQSLVPGQTPWAGVILISAVMEKGVIRGASAFRGLPVLVVFGKRDDRIPWSYVEGGLEALRGEGADLTLLTNEEDHFMFFSRVDEVQGWIHGWISPRLERPR
jgi:poly(3-hydroxybutyrate) depolymerase